MAGMKKSNKNKNPHNSTQFHVIINHNYNKGYAMKTKIFKLFLAASSSIVLLSGCVNQNTLSNPNTQTGAAVGAVTGAVIGGNVGDRSGSNIAGGAVLGAIAGGAIGNAVGGEQPRQTGGWE